MGVPIPVTADTYKSIMFGSGLLIANYDPTASVASQEANWFGALSGGCGFEVTRKIQTPKIDGIPEESPVKGAERIIGEAAKITANQIQIDADVLVRLLPGATQQNLGEYTRIRPGQMDDSDYLGNLAVMIESAARDADSTLYPEGTVFVIFNARGSGAAKFDFKNLDNPVLPVEFIASYDGANMTAPIWEILVPKDVATS